MEQRIGLLVPDAENAPAGELVAALAEAQQRATEQRLLAEQLLAEARSIEERLTVEARQAHSNAERTLAREQAAAAVVEAQREREAIVQVEACAANNADLAQQRERLEGAFADARSTHDRAEANLRECEQRLSDARDMLAQAAQEVDDMERKRADLAAAESAAQIENAAITECLAEHRTARQRFEAASSEADVRAQALVSEDDVERAPSLEAVEELRLLEARVALRAEAAKRAAERRAADAARNHVSR